METRALKFGPEGELVWGTHHVPPPGPNEVAIEIAASGLNRADLLQRRGFYPAPPGAPADVPGLEYAGTVVDCGPGATRHPIGARVMGIVAGGGLARRIVVHEGEAMPVPDHLDLAHAAAIPEAFLTAHDALFSQANLQKGERVLVHAVASGVGAAALQLAAHAGAVVLGTTRTAAKLDALRQAVPDHAFTGLVVSDGAFAARARDVDVVFDLVGASYFAENLDAIATTGRWIVIGAMGGTSAELPLHTLLSKRITLRGTVLRPRPRTEKIAVATAFVRDFGAALAGGRIGPVVDRVLPVDQIEAAWGAMASNETVGKVVVSW